MSEVQAALSAARVDVILSWVFQSSDEPVQLNMAAPQAPNHPVSRFCRTTVPVGHKAEGR